MSGDGNQPVDGSAESPDVQESREEPRRPTLRVVRGAPTSEEVAALVAVLSAASGGAGEPEPPRPPSRWTSRPHGPRGPLHPGPGAWRASALPH
ncbi:Acyl-CoA carboxylase epsilon subunit [Pedococcus cremeus]|uniref:Acyl-CoA carboxylase epsilon subunit n=1 Tax=Pedococcus cremeus TaxID=587636 RepID=A0A1H9X9G2_9MICO|nr:acyl-CoA carboxylase epsilon subunit [Pedococcus cremeus]SES42765.1 Acyl-CoA carboxylase epsilon subunit [Pedococcus cremeus]